MGIELNVGGMFGILILGLILVTMYFIIKYAVKNGIKSAYEEITGKDIQELNMDLAMEEHEEHEEDKKNI